MSARKSRREAKSTHPALQQAVHLLGVGVSSLLAHTDEGCGRPGPDAIRAVVQSAARAVELWIDGCKDHAPGNGYQALSVLMLLDVTLSKDAVAGSAYCDPIINGLELAQELLEREISRRPELREREAA